MFLSIPFLSSSSLSLYLFLAFSRYFSFRPSPLQAHPLVAYLPPVILAPSPRHPTGSSSITSHLCNSTAAVHAHQTIPPGFSNCDVHRIQMKLHAILPDLASFFIFFSLLREREFRHVQTNGGDFSWFSRFYILFEESLEIRRNFFANAWNTFTC